MYKLYLLDQEEFKYFPKVFNDVIFSQHYHMMIHIHPSHIILIQTMDQTLNIHNFLTVSAHLAFQAGNIIKDVRESSSLNIKIKNEQTADPVTEADFKAQTLIITGLRKHWPTLRIVGEEEIEFKGEIHYDYKNLDKPLFPEGQFGKDKNGEDIPGELDLSKVIVWVDPLDATRSYTEGYLDEVTTLIGLSYEGKARLGVVGSFFSKGGSSENPEYQFAPKVYLADSLNSQCTVIDHSRQISTIKPRAYDKARMRLSTTRSKIPENIMTFMKDVSTEIIRQGGMGKKTIEILENNCEALVYLGRGCSTWDIAANEAILLSVDGGVSKHTGKQFDYKLDGKYNITEGSILTTDKQLWSILTSKASGFESA